MSAIKDGGLHPIMLDKERHMLFSLHVIDELEDEIGNMAELQSKLEAQGRLKFITWLFTLLLNEGAAYIQYRDTGKIEGAEVLTERVTALLIHGANINDLITKIYQAFSLAGRGTTDPPPEDYLDDDDYEDEGNTAAGEGE